MARLVLFDIDGTLIRTGGAGIRAFESTGELEFQVRNGTAQMKFAGRTDVSLVREFLNRHRFESSSGNFERFFNRYVFLLDHYLAAAHGGPCAGVWEFIRQLQALHAPPLLGLLTGNIRLGAEIKLRRFGLWQAFVVGAFGDDHEDRNRLAAVARDRGGRIAGRELAPEDTVVVGDTPLDIECGRAIGARVLAVATGGATREQLRAHDPDWAVEDLSQVNGSEVCGG